MVKPKRLGRSLALPMATFLVFMEFVFPDTLFPQPIKKIARRYAAKSKKG